MPKTVGFLASLRNSIREKLRARKARHKRQEWERRLQGTPEERFTSIYRDRAWSSKESISGTGSEYHFTAGLRAALPRLFEAFGTRRILDAPCGDFNWMKHVVAETGVSYVGGDIVRDLIQENVRKYAGEGVSFVPLDITKEPLPGADMMIVRDCLFHLSYSDILQFLENFGRADIPYLLTSTHKPGDFENKDIVTGDFRFIDLFAAPFGFPTDPLDRVDDYIAGHVPREMCLFSREQVLAAARTMASALQIRPTES